MSTITGATGMPLPDLGALGFGRKMKAAARLIEEQGRLWRRAQELGREIQMLEDDVKRLEHEHTSALADAIRTNGAEPPRDAIQAAKGRHAACARELAAVRIAGERSYGDLLRVVREHAPEWDAEVQGAGERAIEEAQEHANKLAAALHQAEVYGHLHAWLESGGEGSFGVGGGAGVSIEALVHARRRALGLIEEEEVVIGL